MNDIISDRIETLYEEFVGFPAKNKIVRNEHKNDAFTLLVFETLFNNYHGIKKLRFEEDAHKDYLFKSIVPPPDDSIDIFFEEKDLDECRYHIVQVKNTRLTTSEIENCFVLMDNSIKTYLTKPRDSKKNLKEIINNTDFGKQYKNECIYYVVHRGSTNYIRNQKTNQKVITENELTLLSNGIRQMCVPKEDFEIDTSNNFIINNFVDNKIKKTDNTLPKSLLCNFSGYDLAKLNNKYSNTLLGKNILYGENLRESLNKNSKTFESMFDTIDNESDLFLFYNNGITIISDNIDAKSTKGKEKITVENFSIINGAQTTSTLGAYLRNAEINNEQEKIENLKKVFVLTKIYEINNSLKNYERISNNIKIFNNTQTPLSSRDMVSIRKEQIDLQEKLLHKSPNIFMHIKKGVLVPSTPKTLPYQRVSNEVLAQLALCSFYTEPFNAKDKKTKIFDNDGKEGILLNPIYNKIFNPQEGILFTKSNDDIDELLFVYKLHEDTKKIQKDFFKKQILNLSQSSLQNQTQNEYKEKQIDTIKRNIEIANVCLFYNITCYFEMKRNYETDIKNSNKLSFNTKLYFDNTNGKNYKEELISGFSELIYSKTIETIRNHSGLENINNWVRSEKSQGIFLDALRNNLISDGYTISKKYIDFITKHKFAKK